MVTKTRDRKLETELAAMLSPSFCGMTVEVAHSERWNRMCVTFRWPGFAGLLPEERFHRLAQVIPAEFRESQLKGFVWLELTPDEAIETYLRLPRSEDVAKREKAICGGLVDVHFFELLGDSLGPKPTDRCPGDFSSTSALLSGLGLPLSKIQDAKLLFIRHGAFCDCQVLETVQPIVRRLLAGAA
jgi:hypothetical protein